MFNIFVIISFERRTISAISTIFRVRIRVFCLLGCLHSKCISFSSLVLASSSRLCIRCGNLVQRFTDSHLRESSIQNPFFFCIKKITTERDFFYSVEWIQIELPYQLIPISCVITKIARRHRLRQLLIRFEPTKKIIIYLK